MRKINWTAAIAMPALLLAIGGIFGSGCTLDRDEGTAPEASMVVSPPVTPQASNPQASVTEVENVLSLLRNASTQSEADEILKKLPPEEQNSLAERMTTVRTVGEEKVTPGDRGSRSVTYSVRGLNAFGQTMWRYSQRVDWTYNGTTITSKSRTRWGEVYAPLWSYEGHVGSSESGGVGQTYYRTWTQGHFCLHFPYPNGPIIQHKYPWIQITAYGNGTYATSWGG